VKWKHVIYFGLVCLSPVRVGAPVAPPNSLFTFHYPLYVEKDMATKSEQARFVAAVYPAAKALWEKQDSIHPLFVTAQAALETGWKLKADGTNNLFGITKGSSWKGEVKLCLATEYFASPDKKFSLPERVVSVEQLSEGRYKYRVYRFFRVYRTLEECLDDHLTLLRKPMYADAWPFRNDPKEYACRIVDRVGAKYATDPNYATTMAKMIDGVGGIVDENYGNKTD
jgi:flagellar protein FlgJ